MTIKKKDTTSKSSSVPAHADRRIWLGLAILVLPALLVSIDLSALDVAVPSLSAALRPSSNQLLWIMDLYGFVLAGFLITMGTLGDRIGRRKLLMMGAAVFGSASILAAFSQSAAMLIAARAVMGVAAATLAPSSLGLISTMFPDKKQRTTAIAVWSTGLSAGGALGPVLGGVLLEHFWWGSIFLLAVPVMVLLLAAAPKLLPEYRNSHAGRLDLGSVSLLLATILLIVYGLKQVAQNGLGWTPVVTILLGMVVGVGFVRWERRSAKPLIDVQLFRIPAFSASLAINLFGFFGLFGVFLFTAQYLQLVLGLSPLLAGLWTVPSFVGFILGSILAPLFVRRVKSAYIMAVGLVVAAVGFAILTQVSVGSGLLVLVVGTFILSLGLGPVFTLVTNVVLGAAPLERAGTASGIAETSTELGGALGIALLGSIGTAVYRHQVAATLPRGLSTSASMAARDTLGGAVATAMQLPERLGQALLNSTRLAFTNGLHILGGIAAIIMIILALISITLARREPSLADGVEK